MFWDSNVFPSLEINTRSLPLTAQSSFTKISVSIISALMPCVNTQRPVVLNKPSPPPLYTKPLPGATSGRQRRQLYKCWRSVPEQHWFCSNQSRVIAAHGKWHSLCAIAYISALTVAGQTWASKWWVGPMSVTTSRNISVHSVHQSSVGGPAVTHISTPIGQTWSPFRFLLNLSYWQQGKIYSHPTKQETITNQNIFSYYEIDKKIDTTLCQSYRW